MYLLDGANTVPDKPARTVLGDSPGWGNQAPGAGPGTVFTPEWFNMLQAELKNVVEGSGQELDKADDGQLLAAIQALIALAAATVPTGVKAGYTGSAAPAGWVLGSGRTIGDAASGATERANADTQALFTLLWTDYADADLPIKTSAGGVSARGGSAGADWAAHKRMTLPDYRGRVGVGRDDMGGTDAALVTVAGGNVDGTVLGKHAGAQNVTLTGANLPWTNGAAAASSGGPVVGIAAQAATPVVTMPPFVIESTIIKL